MESRKVFFVAHMAIENGLEDDFPIEHGGYSSQLCLFIGGYFDFY